MKAVVDDSCISCGLCVEACPEVFRMGDELAEVIADPVPPEHEATAREAAAVCPVDAITILE